MQHTRSIAASDDRAPGATFAPGDIGWIDFESRGRLDIEVGTTRYAVWADAVVLAWAIGDNPVKTVSVAALDGSPLRWQDMPIELQLHCNRVAKGEAIWATWNAGFDRAIWNYATIGFPELEPHHTIDVMAQAVASGLPPDLAMAAKMSGSTHKVAEGGKLISLFCTPGGLKGVKGTPESHPAEWQQFLAYAAGDVEAMRSTFKRTRQLPLAEWREYWAMEAVNERGVGIDLAMVGSAARLAGVDRVRSRSELAKLTHGAVQTVDQIKRMTAWLLDRVPAEGRDILLMREEEVDADTGEISRPAKFGLTRKQVERLAACCQAAIEHPLIQAEYADRLRGVVRVLQIRYYGGSKMPAKFARMESQQVDGILRHQYVFNGAAQTGRASSRGVQIHNLARDTLSAEPDLIDALLAGANYDAFSALGGDDPVARKLALLIRPAFVPRETNVFVWSDWSQIEARIVPWLCDHLPGARKRLEIFRQVDADPSLPDLYTRTAAELSHIPVDQVTKAIRQRGKVAELALGFGGGINALQAMGAGYGLHLPEAEARIIVERWRAANPWVKQFSQVEIWGAVLHALDMPSVPFKAGRVHFIYMAQYLGGSLFCRLPSGRVLTYRSTHWEDLDVLDADDQPTGEKTRELTCARGYGRIKLWPGLFLENMTQGTAADFLRGTLVRLEQTVEMPVRLHTHDEIVCETAASRAESVAEVLGAMMRRGFDWSQGLPLMSEETIGYYYTKHEGSHGL